MCEPTAVGRQPHIHIERYRDWRLAHESKRFYRDVGVVPRSLWRPLQGAQSPLRSLGMGTAHADRHAPTPTHAPDPYDVLFGAKRHAGHGAAQTPLT